MVVALAQLSSVASLQTDKQLTAAGRWQDAVADAQCPTSLDVLAAAAHQHPTLAIG